MRTAGVEVITIISAITSALGVGAIISGTVSRKMAKAEKEAAEKEKDRAKEIILLLTGIKAAGALSYATAVALKRGHANGEVEKGVEAYEEWDQKLDKFLIEQSATQ